MIYRIKDKIARLFDNETSYIQSSWIRLTGSN
jgi:hypothetical protein